MSLRESRWPARSRRTKMEETPRIVEAAFSISAANKLGRDVVKRKQQAMAHAVMDALRLGITDPAELRRLQIEAARSVK